MQFTETEQQIIASRLFRERLLQDPYRPTWHFAIPGGMGIPGDPNGAFYADGRYHLMYLYNRIGQDHPRFCWGHISSADLLHWRHHPDALSPIAGDRGCYSGGAFVDEDQTVYLTFWQFPETQDVFTENPGGIAIAKSRPPYDVWERLPGTAIEQTLKFGVRDQEVDGVLRHLGCSDPSGLWKSGDYYYLQAGNKLVLDTFGRHGDKEYEGGWVELYRSRDLLHWEYRHRMYEDPHPAASWPEPIEDAMCPSFLPLPDARENGTLTDTMLQLFMSHNRGAQCFLGRWDAAAERFYPTDHVRLAYNGRHYASSEEAGQQLSDNAIAPESLIDGRNRHIAWMWLCGGLPKEEALEEYGWSGGVYTFPRLFWLKDNELRMAPADELTRLETHPLTTAPFTLKAGQRHPIAVADGTSLRLHTTLRCDGAAGFAVLSDGKEETLLYVDGETLVIDSSRNAKRPLEVERIPLPRRSDGTVTLDILVDHSVVEIYADERRALAQRAFPSHPEQAVQVQAVAFSGSAAFDTVTTCRIEPTNPC